MNFSKHLRFLSDLSSNNNKDWFHSHNEQYQGLRKEFMAFVQDLIRKISEFEPEMSGLEPKDCIFRINRDIRFSPDKSPYKTNMGAAFTEGGKKSPKAGYYFHLEPGKTFLGGGIWMPEPNILSKIRQEIDYNPEEFKALVTSKEFKNAFGELEGERLKMAPKGYDSDNPMIEVLKLKSFVMTYSLSDKDLENITVQELCRTYMKMQPVNNFLNRVFD